MQKRLLLVPVFILALCMAYAEGITQNGAAAQNTGGGPVTQMDNAVKALAGNLVRSLVTVKAVKVTVSPFSYRDTIPPFSQYWVNQLTEELVNTPNRSFSVLSAGVADWIVSGEIVEAADGIRVYTRLVNSGDRTIAAVFHSDLARNDNIARMLLSGGSSGGGGGGGSSSSVSMDAWEPDSMENPVAYEIGEDENVPAMNRTIHDGRDQDFFLLIPARDGRLVIETTGDEVDTYMNLYIAGSGDSVASDDDGGSGDNARIRYNVQAGRRYIAKVRGYERDETGPYGFRAYLISNERVSADRYESDDDSSSAKPINIGERQQHNFHNKDDVDWVKFEVSQAGRYTIRTSGVRSNNLDTYIELFNADMKSIAEDDDGGDNYSSRLSLQLDMGTYYLKVHCLDDNPDQPYTISVTAD